MNMEKEIKENFNKLKKENEQLRLMKSHFNNITVKAFKNNNNKISIEIYGKEDLHNSGENDLFLCNLVGKISLVDNSFLSIDIEKIGVDKYEIFDNKEDFCFSISDPENLEKNLQDFCFSISKKIFNNLATKEVEKIENQKIIKIFDKSKELKNKIAQRELKNVVEQLANKTNKIKQTNKITKS